jgi:hypothetical protein
MRAKIEIIINIPCCLERLFVRILLLYRRSRYGYAFRRITLTQGKYAIVDPDDYLRLSRYKWYAAKYEHTFYAVRNSHFEFSRGRIKVKMHRDIIHPPAGFIVDHINHNGLDNRKANLRPATLAQNARNSRRRRNRSGYKGVCFYQGRNKYRAIIWHNYKRIHLGYFDSKIAAARAYDTAAKKYHKEFAHLNFPSNKST